MKKLLRWYTGNSTSPYFGVPEFASLDYNRLYVVFSSLCSLGCLSSRFISTGGEILRPSARLHATCAYAASIVVFFFLLLMFLTPTPVSSTSPSTRRKQE